MTTWFTADWHLYHRNIIKYCDRPFKNIEAMNSAIIKNYYKTVKENDTVYFLGDLTMLSGSATDRISAIVSKMPGIKHMILGNHDKFRPNAYLEMGFTSVHTALKVKAGEQDIYMVHDPAAAQQRNTKWICGHVHQRWKKLVTDSNITTVNVGVDVWDFFPVSLDHVLVELSCQCTPEEIVHFT